MGEKESERGDLERNDLRGEEAGNEKEEGGRCFGEKKNGVPTKKAIDVSPLQQRIGK